MAAVQAETPASGGRLYSILALLWFSGMGLRITLLAVPPVIPQIHADLRLSEAAVGALGSLPPLLFALTAIPGSLLIARFGARAALVVGLLLTAAGGAARGGAEDVAMLYAATVVMGAGVAIMQPSMPPLVRAWLPNRISFGTAVYTNGLLFSEILPVTLTIPFLLPFFGGSWRWALAVWSLPVLLTAGLVAAFAPRTAGTGVQAAGEVRRWWPDWSNPLIWRMGFLLGCINTEYFATNTFLPDYLQGLGRGDLINPALAVMNFCQLPASFILLAVMGRIVTRHWAYIGLGLMLVAAGFGIMFMSGWWIVFWAGVIGFANAALLVMFLALPPLLCAAEDVPRITAAMFTISYPTPLFMTIIAGAAWDATGLPILAFVPVTFCAVVITLLSPGIRFDRLAGKSV